MQGWELDFSDFCGLFPIQDILRFYTFFCKKVFLIDSNTSTIFLVFSRKSRVVFILEILKRAKSTLFAFHRNKMVLY